jgi:hypothetical protein
MKKIRKILISLFVLIVLMVINSCTENITSTKNGNLVVWTSSNKNVGVLVKIMNTDLDLKRINTAITTYQPVCGDKNCVNYELSPGEYLVKTSLLTDTYVTIVSGDCYALEIK